MKPLFFFLIICIYYLSGVTENLGLYGDDAGYVIWAKSIFNGGWLDYINEPSPRPGGYNIFVLPLFLSAVMHFTDNIFYLKLVPLIFSAASIIAIYFSLKKLNFKNNIPLIVAILMVFNGLFFEYSHQIMAENVLIFFTFISFTAIEKYKDSNKIINIFAVISAAAGILAFFTRTAGVVSLITIILYFVILKNIRKIFFIISIIIIFFAIYSISMKAAGKSTGQGGNTYWNIIKMKSQYSPEAGARGGMDIVSDSLRKFAVYSLRLSSDAVFYPSFKKIKPSIKSPYFISQVMLGLMISIFVLFGLYSRIKDKSGYIVNSADIYFILTVSMLLLWQIYSSRYLLAVLPLILAYAFAGIFKLLGEKQFFYKFFLAAIIICGFLNQLLIIYNEKNDIIPNEWKYYYAALYKIQNMETGLSGNNLTACRKPTSYFVKSGYKIKTIGYPMSLNPDEINNFMLKNNVKYLVKDNFIISGSDTANKYLQPFIIKYRDFLEEIYRSPDSGTVLYRFKKNVPIPVLTK